MKKIARYWLGYAFVAAAAVTSCAETPLAPERGSAIGPLAAVNYDRAADLGACTNLQVPPGSKLVVRLYADGVQIYRWSGTSWAFVGPSATLSADALGNSTVGIHYSGPTWESVSGGTVVGTVLQRCTPDPNAIPWLLLSAVADGPGIFHRVTFIQRVNTVGGNAPSSPGTFVGEIARVPYTTEYFFYRTQ